MLLKGAIRLIDGLYPNPGWRFMRDLDLLLPKERLNDAVTALAAVGYESRDPEGWPPITSMYHRWRVTAIGR